jgi:hypothetical protein
MLGYNNYRDNKCWEELSYREKSGNRQATRRIPSSGM